jgi:hypothetical protein
VSQRDTLSGQGIPGARIEHPFVGDEARSGQPAGSCEPSAATMESDASRATPMTRSPDRNGPHRAILRPLPAHLACHVIRHRTLARGSIPKRQAPCVQSGHCDHLHSLPTRNSRQRPAPVQGVCAGDERRPGMIGIVQYWLLVIARPQVRILPSEAPLIVDQPPELRLVRSLSAGGSRTRRVVSAQVPPPT